MYDNFSDDLIFYQPCKIGILMQLCYGSVL